SSQNKMKKVIVGELQAVAQKYDTGRRSEILYNVQEAAPETEQEAPDYPVTVFLSAEGYLKKIKTANLRLSGEQKLKEGDTMLREE
ncbi:hypothetical protein ACS2QD_30965, partial [Bacillus cereus group sp. Bce036]|uniref:hypothetical protein n=1 Tax=Bacillus cereus group sp. Bce036 TaxID=3445233 RepID=UPI003F26AE62